MMSSDVAAKAVKAPAPILIDGTQIHAAAHPVDLVDVLRHAFRHDVSAPDRLHYKLNECSPGAALLIMPAWRQRQSIGVKVLTVMPQKEAGDRPTIDGAYLLLDGQTGAPLAVFDAAALTQIRTAAVSALGAATLARPDAEHLLMVGTGALAPHLIQAHLAVRPIKSAVIWGRSPTKAGRLAEAMAGLGCELAVTDDLRRAVRQADIISSATSSEHPLIRGCDVRPGTHVDLVGSFTPAMREADDDLICTGRLVVDSWTALEESGDVVGPLSSGALDRNAIKSLHLALAEPGLGRQSDDDITIFKSVGTALSDLAVAERLFARLGDLRPDIHHDQ